jgi:tetratricopeptide (TPR) repeat protein
MKAEHRKELQTNALADRMGRLLQGVKSRSSSSALVAGVLVGVWLLFSRASRRSQSELWVNLDKITNEEMTGKTGIKDDYKAILDRLEKIIRENPGTKAALVARFQVAQINLLNRGMSPLVKAALVSAVIEDDALKSLDRAEEEFKKLYTENSSDPVWAPQALLGIAKVAETRAADDAGNLEKALELYKELAEKYAKKDHETAAGMEARDRVKAIEKQLKEKDKGFYSELRNRRRAGAPVR